ncbi:MAG: LrgB family protein, partial [Cetobacterium sp.]
GTAKAIEMGEVEGAMSALSIVIAGVITLIFAGVLKTFLPFL